MKRNLQDLAAAPLGPLLAKYTWPALVTMSLNALYSVVDRFFIGRGCGQDAMAALTLAMPVMMLFSAFGVWIGAGHGVILSIRLGEGNRLAAERTLGQLVAFKLLFFFILTPLVFLNVETILSWCGGEKVTPEALALAALYLKIVLFSNVFSHLAFGLSATLRSEGSAVRSMNCLVVGFVSNIILDPLFIFTFKMGVAGAAWATDIAMFLSCLCAFASYWRGKTVVRLKWARVRFYRELAGRTLAVGFAPFLQQLMSSAIVSSLAAAFAKWATSEVQATQQMASLGVFMGMLILTFTPIMGAQQGLTPILGFNWGARNFSRVYAAMKLGFWVTTILCILASAVQVIPVSARVLVGLFVPKSDLALTNLAVHDLIISNCMVWTISFNVLATTYYQAIGKPRNAIILSMLRQGIILLPCIWILPHFMKDHTLAIWLALPISDVLCQLATIPPLYYHMRFLKRAAQRCVKFVHAQ